MVTFNSMESTILGHLAANVNSYKMFHTGDVLTLSAPHATIVFLSYLVKKVPMQEIFSAQSLV